MDWTLDKSRPICGQICEKLCVAIAAGEFPPGQRLMSVREVALLAGVTPNTVQKSFEELESRGVIHSVRCSGWYVCDDIAAAEEEVSSLRRKKSEAYLAAMAQLGCGGSDAIPYLQTIIDERIEHDHE